MVSTAHRRTCNPSVWMWNFSRSSLSQVECGKHLTVYNPAETHSDVADVTYFREKVSAADEWTNLHRGAERVVDPPRAQTCSSQISFDFPTVTVGKCELICCPTLLDRKETWTPSAFDCITSSFDWQSWLNLVLNVLWLLKFALCDLNILGLYIIKTLNEALSFRGDLGKAVPKLI